MLRCRINKLEKDVSADGRANAETRLIKEIYHGIIQHIKRRICTS